MSNAQPPANPYGQPAPHGQPGYPQPTQQQAPPPAPYGQQPGYQPQAGYGYPQAPAPKKPADRGVMRQVLFGAVIVVGFAILTGIVQMIGNASFGGFASPEYFFTTLIGSLFFTGGAVLSALFMAPIAKATSTADLIKRLIVAGAIGTAALLVINIIISLFSVGSSFFVSVLISTGILGTLLTGIESAMLFALGVFVARALPVKERPARPVPPAYNGQQGAPSYVPQNQQGYQPPQTRETYQPQQPPYQPAAPSQVTPPPVPQPPAAQPPYSPPQP